MNSGISAINEEVQKAAAFVPTLFGELNKVVVGQKYLVERLTRGEDADSPDRASGTGNNDRVGRLTGSEAPGGVEPLPRGVHGVLPVERVHRDLDLLPELLELARAKPGALSYGSTGIGAAPHRPYSGEPTSSSPTGT